MKTLFNMFNQILLFLMLKRNIKDWFWIIYQKSVTYWKSRYTYSDQLSITKKKNHDSEKIVSFKDWHFKS